MRWMARVDEDPRAAHALLALVPPLLKPAAFHCQQAAEKMLKAALIAMREAPPKAHEIEALALRLRPHLP